MEAKKIFPVIVLYRCLLSESRTYGTLLRGRYEGEFLVFDNSPEDYTRTHQEPLPPGAHYVSDTANSGLPRAYNEGARLARSLGYQRVLLLDQDTEFPRGAFDCYLAHASEKGMLVPTIITTLNKPFSPSDMTRWLPKPQMLACGTYSLKRYSAVNSGLCIEVDDFFRAGGYSKDVRLDFADFYFLYHLAQVNPDFHVLPIRAVQDFSGDCKDKEKKLFRYKLFLESALGCRYPKYSFSRFQHEYIVLRHTTSRCFRNRTLKYFYLYIKNYWLRKE